MSLAIKQFLSLSSQIDNYFDLLESNYHNKYHIYNLRYVSALGFGDATGNRTPVPGETVLYINRYTIAPSKGLDASNQQGYCPDFLLDFISFSL